MWLNTKKKIKLLALDLIKKYNLVVPIDVYELAEKLKLAICETDTAIDGLIIPILSKAFPHNAIIVIKNDSIKTRKRFTIAHEIYHYLQHSNISFCSKSESFAEREANIFAAELLMPEKEVKQAVYTKSVKSIDDLAYLFYVSRQVAEIRLKELELFW